MTSTRRMTSVAQRGLALSRPELHVLSATRSPVGAGRLACDPEPSTPSNGVRLRMIGANAGGVSWRHTPLRVGRTGLRRPRMHPSAPQCARDRHETDTMATAG